MQKCSISIETSAIYLGGSIATIIPAPLRDHLQAKKGDTLILTSYEDNGKPAIVIAKKETTETITQTTLKEKAALLVVKK